jgi:choice-of-anchor B domain-containing protein
VRKLGYLLSFVLGAGFASASWADSLGDDHKRFDDSNGGWGLNAEVLAGLQEQGLAPSEAVGSPCVNGRAMGLLPCRNIDLQAFVPNAVLNTPRLNDIWGWTHSSGREFALVGGGDGTVFVEITDPVNPRVLGKLASHQKTATGAPLNTSWRGIKVFGDHAYIGADRQPQHGMQVFDLTQLLDVQNAPVEFTETAHVPFGSSHNIVMNEETGYLYVVGTSRDLTLGDCGGGLLMFDVSNPSEPRRVGCYSGDGYTHDAQCVIYRGPDEVHRGKELCFAYNEDTITVVDVTNKATPVQISRTPYNGSRYTHQGWFTNEKQDTIVVNDELDEQRAGVRTTSYIFDVSDLENLRPIGSYVHSTPAIDHNLFAIPNPVDGRDIIIESNYRAGVRILNTVGIEKGRMQEAAFFDVIPANDNAVFSGVWMTYTFFPSGNLVSTDIGNGLYVLRPNYDAIALEATMTKEPVSCGPKDGGSTDSDGSTCSTKQQ